MKTLIAISAAVLLAACQTVPTEPLRANAGLKPTKGNKTFGEANFEQVGNKVRVSVFVEGLRPGQEHGLHIHEKGDCSSGDGMSAGGHYNPAGKPHGDHRSGGERHAGDLPNLRADGYGNASATFDTTGITVGGGSADIIGKGLIVHRDPDDYKSQPAGNAGPRIACAVIQKG